MTTVSQTTSGDSWERVRKEAIGFFKTLGQLVDDAADELSKLTVVSLEAEDRQKVDFLVKARVVETRSQAVRFLIREGAIKRADIFDKVHQTQVEIENLRQSLDSTFASKQTE